MWLPMPPAHADPARRPRGAVTRRVLAVGVCLVPLVLAACATSGVMQRGRQAEQRQDYDQAVVEYSKALRLKPGDAGIRMALERMKLRAAENHYNRGRRFLATGKLDEAADRVPDRARAEPDQRRQRGRAPGDAQPAPGEGRRCARGEDRAGIARRAHARSPAAGTRPAEGPEAAGLAASSARRAPVTCSPRWPASAT